MKQRLVQPGGARLVGRWQEARKVDAAQRVQSLWRRVKAKMRLAKLAREKERDRAARRLQAFTRNSWRRRRQTLLSSTAKDNPCWQPVTNERLLRHEEEILRKRSQYHASMCRGMTADELKETAERSYGEFVADIRRVRYGVWRTLLHREQAQQMIQALDGRNWNQPLPYGVCSAALLHDAEVKHLERKASIVQERRAGCQSFLLGAGDGGATSVAMESRAEEEEADMLLRSLESDLGYDLSAEDS